MAKITKKSLNAFIEESANQYKQSKEEYLNTTAKKCYVVIDEEKNPITWEDGSLMVMNSLENAEAEAEPNEKVITEYDFYILKKAI